MVTILKKRPKVAVHVPPSVLPGQTFDVDVTLEVPREIAIEHIWVALLGVESWVLQPDSVQKSGFQRTVVSLRAVPRGKGVLGKGKHQLRCRFAMPSDAPPSFDGKNAKVIYTLDVHVDIPWWLDVRDSFWLHVAAPPPPPYKATPSVHATHHGAPQRTEPRAEFSLDSTHLVAGGYLRGEVALYNVAHNNYQSADLCVLLHERLCNPQGQSVNDSETRRYRIVKQLASVREGESIRYSMKLPDDVPFSYTSLLWRTEWHFELRLRGTFGTMLTARIPIIMLPKGAEVAPSSKRAPLTVGSDRVANVWRHVAEANGLRFDGEAMTGTMGAATLRISSDHRGKDGLFLVARLSYAPLHLRLDGGLKGGFHRLFGKGVDLATIEQLSKSFVEKHYLIGRDADQVIRVAQVLLPSLQRYRLVDISDDALTIDKRDFRQSVAELEKFTKRAARLASVVEQVRLAIPAPRLMQPGEDSWQHLAQRLGGSLERARMAATGSIDGIPVRVETSWSDEGKPLSTLLELELSSAIDRKKHLHWADGSWLIGGPQSLDTSARTTTEAITAEALALLAEETRVVVTMLAPVLDTKPVLAQLDRMALLASALRVGTGPYR